MFPTLLRMESLQESLRSDLYQFIPELVVCVGIVTLLLVRLTSLFDRVHLGGLAVAVLAVALFSAGYQFATHRSGAGAFFGGMFVADPFASLVRCLVLFAALLTGAAHASAGIPDRDDSADFHALLLGGTLGMMLMASANHLLMVFIAVEMASLPSYALAGFLKGKRHGQRGGAEVRRLRGRRPAASCSTASACSPARSAPATCRTWLPPRRRGHAGSTCRCSPGIALHARRPRVQARGGAVPLLVPGRVRGRRGGSRRVPVGRVEGRPPWRSRRECCSRFRRSPAAAAWADARHVGLAVGVVAAVTVTFGNLAAFGQTNLKRLLAYSTIAHAGYMLLALAVITPAGAAGGAVLPRRVHRDEPRGVRRRRLGAQRDRLGGHSRRYRGLVRRSPVLAVTMTLFLLALLGLPPLAGFAGKFQVFAAVYDAAKAATAAGHAGSRDVFYVLLGVGA